MIKTYPYKSLGHAHYDWLNTRFHFSFAHYFNPERMGFGALRVVNDDEIKPGTGFDPHPHRDMEIITYVRQGAITHRDSQGNEGRTEAGDVQVMSAGTGVVHSEYNLENETTKIYQIWIHPNQKGVTPRWNAQKFPKEPVTDHLPLLVSGVEGEGLFIHQDAKIYGGRLTAGTDIIHPIENQAYALASEGEMTLNGEKLAEGDGAEISDVSHVTIHAETDAEILIIGV